MQIQSQDIAGIATVQAAGEQDAYVQTRSALYDDLEVEIFDSMAPLEAEWRILERDNLASLHQSYDWCLPWVEIFRRPLAIIRGSIDGRTAFILPLEIIRNRGVRRAEFIGDQHSNINTGLFSKEFLPNGDLTAAQTAAVASALRGKVDLAILRNVPLEWRGRTSPLGSLPMNL